MNVLIQREIHVDAPMRRVVAECENCPCPSALTVVPEGAGTRLRVDAEVWPDDLANLVESQLVDILRSIRHRLDAHSTDPAPPRPRASHRPTSQEPNR